MRHSDNDDLIRAVSPWLATSECMQVQSLGGEIIEATIHSFFVSVSRVRYAVRRKSPAVEIPCDGVQSHFMLTGRTSNSGQMDFAMVQI